MRVFPHKTHRTSNGDAMLARTLTFWQKLRAFVGVKEEGSQLVEMAVVAPLLLIILTGMASFGIALYSQQQLGLAASQAVQAVSLDTSQITDPCATIETAVSESLPQWSAANISYNLTIYTGNTTTPSVTTGTLKGAAFTCKSDNADLTQFQPIVLTVSYPYTWFPIMGWAKYGTGASPSTPTGSLTTTQAAMVQ
ncbi:MAG: TadE/TadG family type IV pilus assembly protein [Terracidiphilus sp.]